MQKETKELLHTIFVVICMFQILAFFLLAMNEDSKKLQEFQKTKEEIYSLAKLELCKTNTNN